MQLGAAAFGGDAASGSVALSCRGLSKSFPGVRALSDATLEIAEGEVRALVGSNGAGKSTLIKIIMGVNQRDGGELSLWGEPVLVDSVKEARSRWSSCGVSRAQFGAEHDCGREHSNWSMGRVRAIPLDR